MEKEKAVCLVSGGIDTTVLMHKLVKEGKDVTGIFFDYGQVNKNITLEMAKEQCKKLGVTLVVSEIKQNWLKGSIIEGRLQIKEGINENNIYKKNVKSLSWIPARNNIFLLIAGGLAESIGANHVYAAFQFDKVEWELYNKIEDKSLFPGKDLTPEFLKMVNGMAKYNYQTKIIFKAPFIDNKNDCYEIVELGRRLNIDFNKTYSCRYYPKCNECEQCIIRERRLNKK